VREQRARSAAAGHQLDRVGAEVGDQDVAIGVEGNAVGQTAAQHQRPGVQCTIGRPVVDGALADQGLSAVGIDLHHTARIGRPDRAVGLAEDALGALQIDAQTADVTPIDLPAKEWIQGGAHGL
jgi:hypothetical protein